MRGRELQQPKPDESLGDRGGGGGGGGQSTFLLRSPTKPPSKTIWYSFVSSRSTCAGQRQHVEDRTRRTITSVSQFHSCRPASIAWVHVGYTSVRPGPLFSRLPPGRRSMGCRR